jgi:uncharacterized membrane protein YeaQ/YmgE (transglycosylase-associated protein family)
MARPVPSPTDATWQWIQHEAYQLRGRFLVGTVIGGLAGAIVPSRWGRIVDAVIGIVAALLLASAAALILGPRSRIRALSGALTQATTAHERYVAEVTRERAKRPLPAVHEANLRAVVDKLLDTATTLDEELLLQSFEEHLPGHPAWDLRREFLDLAKQLREAERASYVFVAAGLRNAGLGSASVIQMGVSDERVRALREGRDDPPLPWPWEFESNDSSHGGSLLLGEWYLGDVNSPEAFDAAKAAVTDIWRRLPNEEAIRTRVELEPRVTAIRLQLIVEQALLRYQSLDGTGPCHFNCVPRL